MTSLMPSIITGDVVPGSIVQPTLGFPFTLSMPSRVQRTYVTNTPYGEPIKQEEIQSVPIPPRPTGDDRGGQAGIMKVLQSVLQKQGGSEQKGEPTTKAHPGDRSWRG